jgi:integrase
MFEELFIYLAVLHRHQETPWATERARYLAYRAEQGCARPTLLRLVRELRVVACHLDLSSGLPVSPKQIAEAAEQWAARQRRRGQARSRRWSRSLFVQVATEWLRFLGRLPEPVVESVPWSAEVEAFTDWMARERRLAQETCPAGPTWDDVQRLLAHTATDRPRDIRDRALLLLLAVYGLRASEVVGLRLDHLDWEREVLWVPRAKPQGRTQPYPLVRTVGEASLASLRRVRPRSTRREVFLTLRAPFRPLSPGGLYHVTSSRLTALGSLTPHRGPHALRHACAMRLVAAGRSLKVIGDHLGHRSTSATRLYAKVDLAGLREVAALEFGGVA